MDLNNIVWNKDYDKFIEYLYSIQDLKYLDFHSKLVKDKNIIGIRMPMLKKIAQAIVKTDYELFFKVNTHKTYEEDMLEGLTIGYLKAPFNSVIEHINMFIPYNDNWAVNDAVCANLKIFNNNQEDGYKYIIKLINSKNDWYMRFGLVLLLDYYVNDNYIDKLFNIIDNVGSEEYYVKMANAWLISICFIKYPDKTYNYLLNNNLDSFTFNKAISKICDSYRVDKNVKEQLKKLRR